MSEGLPARFDPWVLARTQGRLLGSVPMATMPRLISLLLGQGGDATIDLRGDTDAQGEAYLRGTATAPVRLTCQRCLQPIDFELEATLDLAPVTRIDEAMTLPSSCDPLLVPGDGLVDVRGMVEDELILELPIVAYHEDGVCRPESVGRQHSDTNDNSRQRPFADLGEILARNNGTSEE